MGSRLFVKGLSDEDVHDDARVESLFASFGLRVRSVERFGPYKERVFYRANGKRVRVRYGRRFAFLDVCPLRDDDGLPEPGNAGRSPDRPDESGSDDASAEVEDMREVAFRNALQRAIRSLNGATWRGSTLRCQFASERWDEKLRREIVEEAMADDMDEEASRLSHEAARHERERTDGENTVRFEDDDVEVEAGMDRGALWAEITEAPRQWVYNYERRLQEVSEAKLQSTSGSQDRDGGEKGENGVDGEEGRKKSLVERFLEQQDVARAKRREDREQREKDSFGTVYAGTRDVRKRKPRDRGMAEEEEEEERMAVVDFWSDGEDDMVAGAAGYAGKSTARGVDLSRFEDSDSDGAIDMDADGEGDPDVEEDAPDDEGGDGSDDDDDDDGAEGAGGGTLVGREDEDDSDDAEDGEDNDDDNDGDSDDDSDGDSDDDSDGDSDDDSEEEDDDIDARDQFEAVSKVFPNAASFHATAPPDQAQAALNAQADRIRTCLKTYRKKSRRLVAKH